jgi:hypothetical protein
MAKSKRIGASKVGKPSKAAPSSKHPRHPFAIVVRQRAAGAEPSPRAYRRRPKHRKAKPDVEPED